jgi:hypothetical protein
MAACGKTMKNNEKARTPSIPNRRPGRRRGEEELLIEHAAVIETSITLQQSGKDSVSKHDQSTTEKVRPDPCATGIFKKERDPHQMMRNIIT